MKPVSVGIYGGTGYTGWELFQLLQRHPGANIQFVSSERSAGENYKTSWPLAPDIILQATTDVNLQDVNCVFLCLPHTQSAEVAAKAKHTGVAVIDLSADLRLKSPDDYEQWYKVAHSNPELLPATYGLPEHFRDEVRNANVVANPGCYATAMLLGLLPLAKKNMIVENLPIIVDAKSGTSGAGRNPKPKTMFSEVHGNFSPYNIGRSHRHLGEVEQQLSIFGVEKGRLIFSPHLLPVSRGILAAIYVPVVDTHEAVKEVSRAYFDEPLVSILPEGDLATLAHVVNTPLAAISVTPVNKNNLIIMVAIDNLLKGAASQAIQNFNLMFGYEETAALLPEVQRVA